MRVPESSIVTWGSMTHGGCRNKEWRPSTLGRLAQGAPLALEKSTLEAVRSRERRGLGDSPSDCCEDT